MTVWFEKARKKWRYKFEIDGRLYSGYCIHPDTKKAASSGREARSIDALIHDRIKRKSAAPVVAGCSLAEALAWYVSNRARHQGQWRQIKQRVQELLSFFGAATDISSITEDHVADYTNWAREQTVKIWLGGPDKKEERGKWRDTGKKRTVTTVNKYLKLLRLAYKTPPAKKHCVPAEIPLLREPKRIPTPIDQSVLENIFNNSALHLQNAIILCTQTGMREKEMLRVRDHQFNFAQRIIYLDEKTKSGSGRPVYVNEIAYQTIRRCQEAGDRLWKALQESPSAARHYAEKWKIHGRGDIPLILFAPRKGLATPVSSISTAWRAAKKRAGLSSRVRFHDTRASFCSYLAQAGVSPVDIQRLAGHKSIQTTMLYVKGSDSSLRSAVDLLAAQSVFKVGDEIRTQEPHTQEVDRLKKTG